MTTTEQGPVGSTGEATGWHRLRVARVRPLTDDAVALTLDLPERLAGAFAHRPGQHVTVRHVLNGTEIRRSYSICPPPHDQRELRLVVKRLGPGGFAEYATTGLAAGDELDIAPPTGGFELVARPGAHHVMVAAGSGITPLLSMATAALRDDPRCRVSLVHINRTARSVLLADELADLKDAYVDRFHPLYPLTRETREAEMLSGRIDPTRLSKLLRAVGAEPDGHTYFYLCGPGEMVTSLGEALTRWGADPARIRSELFSLASRDPSPPVVEPRGRTVRITASLGGRTTVAAMEDQDRVALDALLRARPDIPYSCREGLCGSCRARVTHGAVTTGRQYVLGPAELAAGYTLACRARPESDETGLDFDV
ncbi:2Fe-2S iron-sulfur cluster-binding protein [Streptomyces spongiae]|uniref:2Fe-2S iron-sulfur cluster binding domain-containing protein n=1 Tax=Streptomyces spongiae TaxID=565072 RepID=A0A5N8XCT8_9ACTN|nr:2Fe-2S iron-sulfur cluster-binding protein [Streptomyces spongiae]MPY56994.1 2Fe-2S iron-sulfur cluster binding domain-containing protein [Streptomyces spongiae]